MVKVCRAAERVWSGVQRRVSYRLASSRLAIGADAVALFNTGPKPLRAAAVPSLQGRRTDEIACQIYESGH